MRLPIDWLKNYIDTNKNPREIAKSLTSLGLMLDKPIENNVLNLEHRMDRADWLSITGCARDLAAFENTKYIHPKGFIPESKGKGGINIDVKAKNIVNRFNTRVFKNIKVEPSPEWLKTAVEGYGIPSKNNIVDITNYVMVELGQPLHAQDINKLSNPKIVLRMAKDDEHITTLLGDRVELDNKTLVLSDGDDLLAIGGIVGGEKTAVTQQTTDIVLDAGNYDQANIRKTSRRLGIRNETSLRTEKFLHPHLTQEAIERATKLILDITGGEYYENVDYYPNKVGDKIMDLRFSRIEKLSGMDVNISDVRRILESLEYKIIDENKDGYKLEVPYFRTDVMVEDDIVSDILRIGDYSNIPESPVKAPPPDEITPEIYKFENKIRDELIKLGMHEYITDPLVKLNPEVDNQIELENALNANKNALRTSIYETLRPVIDIYKKHKIDNANLFEIGLIYTKEGDKYQDLIETRVVCGLVETKNNIVKANKNMRKIVSAFLQNLGIQDVVYKKEMDNVFAYQGDLKLGEIKLDSFTFYTKALLEAKKVKARIMEEIKSLKTEDVTVNISPDDDLGPVVEKIKQDYKNILEIKHTDTYMKDGKSAVTFRVKYY